MISSIDTGDGSYILISRMGWKVGCHKKDGRLKRCIKIGEDSYESHQLGWSQWLMPPGEKSVNYSVFIFRPSSTLKAVWPKMPKQGYVIARDMNAASKWLSDHFGESARRRCGLAKDGLTQAMKKLNATSNAGKFTGAKRDSLNRPGVIEVKTIVGDGKYSVYVADNLYYAAKAVKGGQSGVQAALMTAANGVNGAINAYVRRHGASFFDDSSDFDIWKAPFGEMVKSHHRE